MSNARSLLSQLSGELSAAVDAARPFTVAVHAPSGHSLSGVLWRAGAVVVSEQAVPDAEAFDVTVDGRNVTAHLAGRDPGSNVAVLKLDAELPHVLPAGGAAKAGALALVLGAHAEGPSARLALVRSVSGPWQSLAGGTIDARIVLDTRIGSAEGGPVLSADGALLGISTRGARWQSLVIPVSTVDTAVTALLEKGSVERGWLGLALRPVELPESLRPETGQRIGLMVMDVTSDSPGAKAGIVSGDILLSFGGTPVTRFGSITRQLGANSIGKTVPIILARAGALMTKATVIEARKAA
jgi:S1-C subfamily serine protease